MAAGPTMRAADRKIQGKSESELKEDVKTEER